MKDSTRNILHIFAVALMVIVAASSCQNGASYSAQKEKEYKAISNFVKRDVSIVVGGDTLLHVGKINKITEEEFENQGYTTDVDDNEYVYFEKTGVYMQIVREGAGKELEDGDSKQLIVRFWEYNILGDSMQLTNRVLKYAAVPEYINVSVNSGTISGTFDTTVPTGSLMYTAYGSTSVPTGWLVPLSYVKVGRQTDENGIAKVRLLVPHGQGQANASSYVYPCFYEMTFQESPTSAPMNN